MKLLILSDVHGNLTALEAVLAAEPSFDGVVFCGDAVDYGPDPAGCFERLRQLQPLVWVRGNHDNAAAFGIDCGCSQAYRELSEASRRHTRAVLDPGTLQTLGRLPTEARSEFGGLPLYVTHATPRDNLFEYVSPDLDAETWEKAMAGAAPGTPGTPGTERYGGAVLVGHTHRPYVQRLGPLVVVNPGSVGQPRDKDPRAAYAVWTDGRFELRRAAYDVARVRRRLAATDLPPAVADALGRILETGG